MKIKDVLGKEKMGKEEIFSKAKRVNGKLTAKACGDLWKKCRASAADDNGYQAELLQKEWKILHNAYKRVGHDFPEIIWAVMENWVAFGKHAEKTTEAFNVPTLPNIPFFVKFMEAAADFAQTSQGSEDHGFVQLSAKPKKPLTKPKEKGDNMHTAISLEEVLAIGKDMFE